MRNPIHLFVLLAVAINTASAQTTFNVPSTPYPSIQSAIDAAGYFDTILVAAGTYHESLVIHHKHLTIEGAGPNATIIDSDGLGRCLKIEQQVAGITTLRHLGLREGVVGGPGGGIYALHSNTVGTWTLVIDDVTVEDCKATEGNGIFGAAFVQIEISNSTIQNNRPIGPPFSGTEARGGGIHAWTLNLVQSQVLNNKSWQPAGSGYGGGIYVLEGHLTVENSTIRGNFASGHGGGIDAKTDFTVNLLNSVIAENVATAGTPGLWLHNGGPSGSLNALRVVFDGCLIAGNHTDAIGMSPRIINLDAAVIDIRNTTITRNGLPGEDMTALFATRFTGTLLNSYFVMENSIVAGNMSDRVFCQALPSKTVTRSLLTMGIEVLPPGSVTLTELLTGLDAAFLDPGRGDFRLRPGSPCVDRAATISGSPTVDLGGEARLIGAAQDMGCFEVQDQDPGAALAGTVTAGDVLYFNGMSGGTRRTVMIDAGSTCTLAVVEPTPGASAPFILWGYLGVPGAADVFPIPFAGGSMAFTPHLLAMGSPLHFTMANNLLEPPSGLLYSTPAPWSVTGLASPFPITMTLQGLIVEGSGPLRITNAMTLHAR